jgi:hypothetical protein
MTLTYTSPEVLDIRLIDIEKLSSAYAAWKHGECDHVIFRCYNQAEAKMYRDYVNQRYPDYPIIFTWLDFDTNIVHQEGEDE